MAAINSVIDVTVEDDVAVLTVDSPPVNALSGPVRQGLLDAVEQAQANEAVRAVVLLCAGRTFIAGADIAEFAGAGAGPGNYASLDEVTRAIEASDKPVVAAIHGTALGGGLEVTLACHFRVAVPSARCGLPEVNIGLVPGCGGTQRLPRAVGPELALDMVTTGRHVGAVECQQHGLIDELVLEGELREQAIRFARGISAERRPLRRLRDEDTKVAPWRHRPELFEKARAVCATKFRGFLAPERNIRCIEAAVNLPFVQGLAEERRQFAELLSAGQSAALQYCFFASRRAAKLPGWPHDTPARGIAQRMMEQYRRQATELVAEGVPPGEVDRVLVEFGFPKGPLDGSLPEPDSRRLRSVSDQEVIERCLYAAINEGANAIAEGGGVRPSDVDVLWVRDYGWPAYRGGPMYYADQLGL